MKCTTDAVQVYIVNVLYCMKCTTDGIYSECVTFRKFWKYISPRAISFHDSYLLDFSPPFWKPLLSTWLCMMSQQIVRTSLDTSHIVGCDLRRDYTKHCCFVICFNNIVMVIVHVTSQLGMYYNDVHKIMIIL